MWAVAAWVPGRCPLTSSVEYFRSQPINQSTTYPSQHIRPDHSSFFLPRIISLPLRSKCSAIPFPDRCFASTRPSLPDARSPLLPSEWPKETLALLGPVVSSQVTPLPSAKLPRRACMSRRRNLRNSSSLGRS